MEEKTVVHRGNLVEAKISILNYNAPFTVKMSKEYVISGAARFQIKVIAAQVNNGHTNTYNNLIFVMFAKIRAEDELTYIVKFSSSELGIADKRFTSDDGTWHLVAEHKKQQYSFDVTARMEVAAGGGSFAALHDDEELTDFELRGEGGTVRVHRAVLAAASPVLRRMLAGSWREASEGHVEVAGTSQRTLQHLKDYVYLRSLPDTGLDQLLLLASYYMMPELEQKCVDSIVATLTAQNACELLEFAAKNRISRLLLAILDCVQGGGIQVSEMREHYLNGE